MSCLASSSSAPRAHRLAATAASLRATHPAELGARAAEAALERAGVAPADVDEVFVGHGRQAGSGPNPARQVGAGPGCRTRAGADHQSGVCVRAAGDRAWRAGDSARSIARRPVGRHGVDEPHAVPHRQRGRALGPQDGQLLARRRDVPRRVLLPAVAAHHGPDRRGARAAVRDHARGVRRSTRSRASEGRGGDRGGAVRGRDHACAGQRREGRRRSSRPRRASARRRDDRGPAQAAARLRAGGRRPGIITAGTSSGITDGGAAVVLPSADDARQRGLRPLARIVGWATAGVDPRIMGIGPVPAVRKLLDRTGPEARRLRSHRAQ